MPLPDYPIAQVYPSQNFDERPRGVRPDAIVLHATTGPATPSLRWLANPNSGVSIHYLIDRDGTVYQMVEESMRAWHAGPSNFQGRSRWNDFSVGIELVNLNNGSDPYDQPLVDACHELCVYLVQKYTMRPEFIASHAQISGPLTGKSDPRNFPLDDFIASVMAKAGSAPGVDSSGSAATPPPITPIMPTPTPVPVPTPVANPLPAELRMAAWMAVGIVYFPDAAFQRKAKELSLGRPVTNELRVDVNGVRWAFQAFRGGILATEEGNWGNVRLLNWL